MIERIFDNYYTKKLFEEIKWRCSREYLDCRCVDNKNTVMIRIKPQKFNDLFYTTLLEFSKTDSFKCMCDLDNFIKKIDRMIDEYQKNI